MFTAAKLVKILKLEQQVADIESLFAHMSSLFLPSGKREGETSYPIPPFSYQQLPRF